MSKRTPPKNETYTTLPAARQPMTAVGHAGHVLTVDADYGVYCETEGVYVRSDQVAGRHPGT